MLKFAGVVIILATVTGCTVGPDYVRPDVDTPDEWRFTIEDASGTTVMLATVEVTFQDPEQGLVPVPEGAAIRGFDFQGSGAEPSAELLPKDKAVATYEAIVAKIKDPALLEFAGLNLIRSSVFPVDPNGTQKIRLIYEHLLTAEGPRVDYALPRTEWTDHATNRRVC